MLTSSQQIIQVGSSKQVKIWQRCMHNFAQVLLLLCCPMLLCKYWEKRSFFFVFPFYSVNNGENQLINDWQILLSDYPIVSIEDPFDSDDWGTFKAFTELGVCQVHSSFLFSGGWYIEK